MFGERFRTERHPLTKKAHPHQRTTGVVRTSSIHFEVCLGINSCRRRAGIIPPMAKNRTGSVSARPIQNFLDRSRISWAACTSSVPASTGSRGIPQMGQSPGRSCLISGCIGQVYPWSPGRTGTCSSAIPHFGQSPGPLEITFGCIGQVHWPGWAIAFGDSVEFDWS